MPTVGRGLRAPSLTMKMCKITYIRGINCCYSLGDKYFVMLLPSKKVVIAHSQRKQTFVPGERVLLIRREFLGFQKYTMMRCNPKRRKLNKFDKNK